MVKFMARVGSSMTSGGRASPARAGAGARSGAVPREGTAPRSDLDGIRTRIDGYLNPAAFTTAPQLYPAQCLLDANFCTTNFGNLGRNVFRGPAQQNWDFSLIKNF